MATGEYISVKSQNELTHAEVELERQQHARDREGKLDRLTQLFMDKGVSPNLAEAVSRQISADPDRAVDHPRARGTGPRPRGPAVAEDRRGRVVHLLHGRRAGPAGPVPPRVPGADGGPGARGGCSRSAAAPWVARLAGRPAFLGGLRQFTAAFLATGMAFFIGHLVGAHVG